MLRVFVLASTAPLVTCQQADVGQSIVNGGSSVEESIGERCVIGEETIANHGDSEGRPMTLWQELIEQQT